MENIKDEFPELQKIEVSLFNKRNNKTTSLINNQSDSNFMKGQGKAYIFELTEPIFLSRIIVTTSGYNQSSEFKFGVLSADNSKMELVSKNIDGQFTATVNQFSRSFSFKPDSNSIFSDPRTITQVEVWGYKRDQFKELEEKLFSLEEFESEILEKEDALRLKQEVFEVDKIELETSITSLSEQKTEIEAELETATSQLNDTNSKITINLEAITNSEEKLSVRTSERKDAVDGLNAAKSEVKSAERELARLNKGIFEFPAVFSSLTKQGWQSIFVYVALSLPFIIAILYVTDKLFDSAFGQLAVTQAGVSSNGLSVLDNILIRIPFALVAFAIVEVSATIVSGFIAEIVRINNQRLNLQKISIIAKEVTNAGTTEGNFSDTEKFELETSVRMQLLKDHMKGYISEDFVYKGTLVHRLYQRFKKKTEEAANKAIDVAVDPTKSVTPSEGE